MFEFIFLIVLLATTASFPLLLLAILKRRSLQTREAWAISPLIAVALGFLGLAFALKLLLLSRMAPDTMRAFIKQERSVTALSAEALAAQTRPQKIPRQRASTISKPYSEILMSAPPERHRWQALPAMAPYPADNPPNPAKIALGKRLFNDRNLSLDRSVSCASCHNLYVYAGADGKTQAEGIGGQKGVRNTPTVWNSAFQRNLFWDGRSNNLEHQALQPILNPIEMGLPSEQAIVERVRSQADYHDLFFQAFGERNISSVNIAKALASYERTLITNDSPYDDFVRGDSGALKQQQLNGMVLFEQLGCVYCHAGPNFSVASVYSEGLALRLFPAKPTSLTQSLTLNNPETGKPTVWRVPSLRNVALTGPWLHNGSVDTLEEVVRMMAESQLGKSGHRRVVWSDNALSVIDSSPLTDSEVHDIVAFLKALSSKRLLAASETQNPPPNLSEP